jgi:protoporphyrinogen/coproporphyrinogen III oxidase
VQVLEASDRAGGVIRTIERDGFLLELGPNTVRATPEILALAADLGLEDRTIFSDPGAPRFIAIDGRLHKLPQSPGEAISTSLLSAGGKLRLLAEPLVPRRRAAAEESVLAFFSRRIGLEGAARLVTPFVSGIFAGDPNRLSAEGCFPGLAKGEREHGSLVGSILAARRSAPKKPHAPRRGLLSFREGLETLPRTLAAALGNRLETGRPVLEVSPSPARGSWSIRTERERVAADRVVLACPADVAARLVASFSPEAAEALSAISQPPLAVLHLAWPRAAFREKLHGFGHLVVPSPGRRVLGAVWSSALFAGRAPEGEELLTVFLGGACDPGAAELPDGMLLEAAGREVGEALGLSTLPRAISIERWKRAIPQYEIGHRGRMETLSRTEARWPGLRFLGSYRGGVSVGDVVRNGLAAAAAMRSTPDPK